MIKYETLTPIWPRRQRPAEYDIETNLGHVREMLSDPTGSTFPVGPSAAAGDLREALADRTGYHSPKVQWIKCKRSWCGTERLAMWVVVIARNGVRHAQLRCIACCAIEKTIGADKVGVGWPILRNFAEGAPDCDRCGSSDGTELHHWAPSHLFEDSWQWPTSYLCRQCHTLWHQIVTPKMNKRIA